MGQRVRYSGEVNLIREPKRNRVLIGQESLCLDPKPGDLAMSRMKVG